jgi:preprotein translocase subunit SecY
MLDALNRALKLPDLRNKVLFTFAMLVVFRVIAHIPVPGVNYAQLQQLFQTNQLLGMLDLFSGGAMTTFSIAAMGVYPYITAQIIMQLLIPTILLL